MNQWTTYRNMAEETVDAAVKNFFLHPAPASTQDLKLVGAHGWTPGLQIQLIQQVSLLFVCFAEF